LENNLGQGAFERRHTGNEKKGTVGGGDKRKALREKVEKDKFPIKGPIKTISAFRGVNKLKWDKGFGGGDQVEVRGAP